MVNYQEAYVVLEIMEPLINYMQFLTLVKGNYELVNAMTASHILKQRHILHIRLIRIAWISI